MATGKTPWYSEMRAAEPWEYRTTIAAPKLTPQELRVAVDLLKEKSVPGPYYYWHPKIGFLEATEANCDRIVELMCED